MKLLKWQQLILRFSSLSLLSIALQGGCVAIKDSKNRDNQIENASKTYVEAYMAKRILEKKEIIKDTYFEIYHLQDSIRKALGNVHTVADLKTATLLPEIRELANLDNDLLAYVDYESSDAYSHQFGQLLLSPDVHRSSEELFRMIYLMRSGNNLPKEYQEMKKLVKDRNTFLFNLQEFLNKRALTASQGYRNLAEVYRQKGIELHEVVLQDKRLTMTDLERIETERLAEKYLAISLEFIERSDSLLAASKEARNPWKAGAEIKINKHLRLQNLAN